MQDMPNALLAERDLLRKSLEAREADQGEVLQSVRRSQDLAAEAQRLQRAQEQSQMRISELQARNQDLEERIRTLTSARDESVDREHALQASLAEARIHFQERVEQLGQSLATLSRLRQSGTSGNEAI